MLGKFVYKEWWCISGADFLDVGGFDPGDVVVHLLVHGLQLVRILFELHELFLKRVQIVHGIRQ